MFELAAWWVAEWVVWCVHAFPFTIIYLLCFLPFRWRCTLLLLLLLPLLWFATIAAAALPQSFSIPLSLFSTMLFELITEKIAIKYTNVKTASGATIFGIFYAKLITSRFTPCAILLCRALAYINIVFNSIPMLCNFNKVCWAGKCAHLDFYYTHTFYLRAFRLHS